MYQPVDERLYSHAVAEREVVWFDDARAFLEACGAFLEEREAEHNLMLGICRTMTDHPELVGDSPPVFLALTDDRRDVVAASVRTPPYRQVLAAMDEDAAASLARSLADAGHALPGVVGPTAAASGFAAAWETSTGQHAELMRHERMFQLTDVIPPEPAPGTWRVAEERDRNLIRDWYAAFAAEAMPSDPPPDDIDALADRLIRRVGRTIYLWEDGGRPVCLVGAGGETPGTIRIGPVYTPPQFRGRGYASNLTAAVSQAQLDAGKTFCVLFTDVANPTSNKIYQAIGYEPLLDVDEYAFVLATEP